MKVGTITFGYSQNLGALLQAYALREYIESIGHDCEIIQYKEFDNRPFETIKGIPDAISDVLFFGACKKKIKKINQFRQHYLRFTSKCYHNTEEMRELNGYFDAFVAGSDQIWNVHKGIVDEFFLSFASENRRKIAYSASFGLSALPTEYVAGVREGLSRFDKISIRETSGVKIAKELTGKEYMHTLDPVFLKSKADWEKLCPERLVKEKYIFVYPTQITPELKATVKAAKEHFKCKVYSLFYFVGVDKVVKDADPLDFLNYIRNSEIVIASSFHATAFAVIFEKNLKVVPHSTTGSRVVDLLNDIGLTDCIVGQEELSFEMKDRSVAMQKCAERIAFSKQYLMDALTEKVDKE